LYARDRSSYFFLPDQVEKLAQANLATLNHLLPILRERIYWKPFGDEVILMGVDGEIYIKSPGFQKPIEEAVEKGKIHIGDAISQRLKLDVDDKIEISGSTFTIHRLLPAKGNIDDITILMNLEDAQRVLNRKDDISGVLALSCNCAAGDLEPINLEVKRIIPGVRIVEFAVRSQARQQARMAIQEDTQKELDDIKSSRSAIRKQMAEFAILLVSVITTGMILFIVALTVINTRQRRTEIAMLRTMGLSSGQILLLFISKAALIGLLGSLLGCAAGFFITQILGGSATALPFTFVLLVSLIGMLISIIASIIPAVRASRQSPAIILNQE
jgi:putative ABC transport system permease protein